MAECGREQHIIDIADIADIVDIAGIAGIANIASIAEEVGGRVQGVTEVSRNIELLVYLGARARAAVFRGLRGCNFSLLEGPSCFGATAFYRESVELPFRSSRGFKALRFRGFKEGGCK